MKGRILITDDEEHFRFSSRVALRKAGYEVEEAENGEVALALLGSGMTIDLIVLDLNMPRISGEAVVAILKGRGSRIPIVAISGLTDRFVAKELLKRGCAAFMEKPFTPDDLVHTVDALLALGETAAEAPACRALATSCRAAGAVAVTDGGPQRRSS